jgi:aconitate hydratase 2/2-methylisocitrate dehydratase
MIAEGYQDARSLQRRIDNMKAWLADPQLLQPDADAEYAAVIEIDLNEIKEPLLACPNDPDDIKPLSEVAGVNIDEVFIGSCMTNIGHYRAAGKVLEKMGNLPTKLWVAPPTKMDARQLTEEGYYSTFGRVGARTETPGCSLCMGNQARVADNAKVVSTSTRNFPNRLGNGADVYLSSAELAAVVASMGRIPTVEEYLDKVVGVETMSDEIYRYLNFNEMEEYTRARA